MSEHANGSVVQAAGKTADRIVSSLSSTPTLLVIVLLNIAMFVIAGWFLTNQENNRHAERLELGKMLANCMERPPR